MALAAPELSAKVDLFSAESREIVFSLLLLSPTSIALIRVIILMLYIYLTRSLSGFKSLNKLDTWQLTAVRWHTATSIQLSMRGQAGCVPARHLQVMEGKGTVSSRT